MRCSAFGRTKNDIFIREVSYMYNPDELMQEFKQFTLLEKIALETGGN